MKGKLINMKGEWDQEKFWVAYRNRIHDLPSSYEFWVHMWIQLNDRSETQIFYHSPVWRCHIDQFAFHILLPSLKFTIFIHISSLFLQTIDYIWGENMLEYLSADIVIYSNICSEKWNSFLRAWLHEPGWPGLSRWLLLAEAARGELKFGANVWQKVVY